MSHLQAESNDCGDLQDVVTDLGLLVLHGLLPAVLHGLDESCTPQLPQLQSLSRHARAVVID